MHAWWGMVVCLYYVLLKLHFRSGPHLTNLSAQYYSTAAIFVNIPHVPLTPAVRHHRHNIHVVLMAAQIL